MLSPAPLQFYPFNVPVETGRTARHPKSGDCLSFEFYRIHPCTYFKGTSIRSATCSGVIPPSKKRLQTTFIFSPTSTICLSGSKKRTTRWPHECVLTGWRYSISNPFNLFANSSKSSSSEDITLYIKRKAAPIMGRLSQAQQSTYIYFNPRAQGRGPPRQGRLPCSTR